MKAPPRQTKQRLLDQVNSFRESRIILSAFELGLFAAAGRSGRSAGRIAAVAGADARACERLLAALAAMGLMRLRGGRFRCSAFAWRHLVPGRPEFLAGLGHSLRQYDSWSRLTESVRRGGPAIRPGREPKGWLPGFIAAMHDRAMPQAPAVLRLLGRVPRGGRLLDVGAGSGAYAIAFLELHPGTRATLFDRPQVIPIARSNVGRAGLARRVEFRAGDFNRDRFGSGYDLALLSAVIHMQPLRQSAGLFRRIHAALKPGGRLAIQDYVMSPSRLEPAAGAYFALNMLVNTAGGDTFTFDEIRRELAAAGFVRCALLRTPFPASLVVAEKPEE